MESLPLILWLCLLSRFPAKMHNLCSRVLYGRSRSFKVVDFRTNRKGVWDSLLVINSNLGFISHGFWDTVTYWLKIVNFPHAPSFNTLDWGDPFQISKTLLQIPVAESFTELTVKTS